jgi:hypothetical protein
MELALEFLHFKKWPRILELSLEACRYLKYRTGRGCHFDSAVLVLVLPLLCTKVLE